MTPYLLSLMCLTGLQPKDKCLDPIANQNPISSYILNNIWNPTNPYIGSQYESGYWTTSKKPPEKTLKGKTLRIAAVEEPPYVNKIYLHNKTLDGTAKIVIAVLRQALEFDWEIVTPEDGTVGIYNETTGKWSGIIGMLLAGEADFSIQFMSMLAERMEVLNFSRPFGEERWVVMMQRPQETTDGEGLVAPFQQDVWIYIMISFVLMCPFVYIMNRLRSWACRKHPHLSESYSIGHCIWFVYGAVMKQGSVLKPLADSSRILFATWWIFVTILSAFYTANLTAYLTLSKVPIPYNSLSKVGYRDAWIMKKGDTLQQVLYAKPTKNDSSENKFYYLGDRRNPEFKKLRWRLGQDNAYGKFMLNMTEMVDDVRRKKFLLLEEQNRVQRIIYKDFRSQSKKRTLLHKRCIFIMSKIPILRIPYSFAFPPNSTYKDVFDPVLDRLTTAGIFNFWRREDLPSKDPCSSDSDFRERQLRNGDLWTTYQLCGTGYTLGLITFIYEIVHKWLANRKLKGQLTPMQNNPDLSFYKGNLTVPAGAPTFFDTEKFLKNINGRDYIVMKTADGRTRLVPKTDGLQALQPVYNPPPPISFSFMS